jgi:hypothetical protein
MNARHAMGLEVLQKEHLAQMSAMQTQAETAESHATARTKNFNALLESHTQELKGKSERSRRSAPSTTSWRIPSNSCALTC